MSSGHSLHPSRERSAASIRLLAVVLIAALVAMYGPFDRLAQADGAQREGKDFTGEEIFRATFFGNGPAAELLPDMQAFRADAEKNEAYDPREAEQVEHEVMATLESQDPEFFDTIRAAFTSGDPRTVSEAHGRASEAVLRALHEYQGLDPKTLPEDSQIGAVTAVAVVAIAVAVAVAVAVVVELVVAEEARMPYDDLYEMVDLDDYDNLIDRYSGSLEHDVFIANVTDAFATQH